MVSDKELLVAGENKYELQATSYRLGFDYNNQFASNWSFNGGLDYLYMVLDDEIDGNVYSNGFSYTAGVTYRF